MREIKLCLKIMQPASGRSPAGHVEPCHWSEGYVGVSLQERRDPMQVGMSLRARWDATLVKPMADVSSVCLLYAMLSSPIEFIAATRV